MIPETDPLLAEIRKWLIDHPIAANQELDIHEVPVSVFDLSPSEDRLKQLNHQIKSLPLQQQKLLLWLSRDLEPVVIIESMEYASPELFWLDKALLIKEIDPVARQKEVLQVFEINQSLLDQMITVSDLMDAEQEKVKKRKYRNWGLAAAPVVLVLFWLFIYPILSKPDPVALFDRYKITYRVDLSAIDTVSYQGGAFYEANLLMDEGNFNQAATLFEELIAADSTYRTPSRWFLGLLKLRSGDIQSCKEQLNAIRGEDPVFYKKVAEKLVVR